MAISRRDSLKIIGTTAISLIAASQVHGKVRSSNPIRLPLHEFVQDKNRVDALRRGVRKMKARKPSDPLGWFYQAAIHGVTPEMIQLEARNDPRIITVDQRKYWNQCPHFGQASANFLPWHRGYTHYFEKILRAHVGDPSFALPYWDYSLPENYRFPREFGIEKLDESLDGDDTNPLYHIDRNMYFTSWQHWSGDNLPYSQLTPEAVDWSPAENVEYFFGYTERDGLGGCVDDENPMTRGLLESFPHDPIHRLTGIIIPPMEMPNPSDPQQSIQVPASSRGMSSPPTAGFDPIFCIHHSNIDRLWAKWSCMSGKTWGNFPPQDWFDDSPWYFFDVEEVDGQLKAIEVNEPRKAYFDYRDLNVAFSDINSATIPLTLPDEIPPSPDRSPSHLTLVAKIDSPKSVSGVLPERISIQSATKQLAPSFAKALDRKDEKTGANRVLLRISGITLGSSNATGFDVHLLKNPKSKPKRTDPSFVGSIAIFRHDQHWGTGRFSHGHNNKNGKMPYSKKPSDMFDVTKALAAAGNTDPTTMHVVIVPFSLSETLDKKSKIIETNALKFESLEFFTK